MEVERKVDNILTQIGDILIDLSYMSNFDLEEGSLSKDMDVAHKKIYEAHDILQGISFKLNK